MRGATVSAPCSCSLRALFISASDFGRWRSCIFSPPFAHALRFLGAWGWPIAMLMLTVAAWCGGCMLPFFGCLLLQAAQLVPLCSFSGIP